MMLQTRFQLKLQLPQSPQMLLEFKLNEVKNLFLDFFWLLLLFLILYSWTCCLFECMAWFQKILIIFKSKLATVSKYW